MPNKCIFQQFSHTFKIRLEILYIHWRSHWWGGGGHHIQIGTGREIRPKLVSSSGGVGVVLDIKETH